MFSLTSKKMDKLLLDFIHLYYKLKFFPDKLTYYDKCLIHILDEYSFLIDDRKILISRSFID